jgi:hypothetical protein
LICSPGVSQRNQRVVEESLLAIYPAWNNDWKTCTVTLVLTFKGSMGTLRGIRRLLRLVVFGLVVGAIATELSKPQAERTWHGRVLDTVPYDFRPPTWERIRSAYWNPNSDRLFSDRVFGVGWAVNLHRAKTLMEEGFRQLMGTQDSLPIRMSSRPDPDVTITKE